MSIKYKRILLKLSGEVLAGGKGYGIDPEVVKSIAGEIAQVQVAGVQIGIVIGGGNIMRGATVREIPRVTADTMGMLATVMNSLALKEMLCECGAKACVLNAVHIDRAGEFFTQERAMDAFNRGQIVIIAGGTGSPFFTTDTAAALRCAEIGAEVLLKATKVDGVYDCDPMKNTGAVKFDRISHSDALVKGLKVMDATAFSFCMENSIPIIVFKLLEKGNLLKCVEGQPVGSIIKTGG